MLTRPFFVFLVWMRTRFGFVFVARRGTRLRVLAFAALAGGIAAGLAPPQILPSLELASLATSWMEPVGCGTPPAGSSVTAARRGAKGLPFNVGWVLNVLSASFGLYLLGVILADQLYN